MCARRHGSRCASSVHVLHNLEPNICPLSGRPNSVNKCIEINFRISRRHYSIIPSLNVVLFFLQLSHHLQVHTRGTPKVGTQHSQDNSETEETENGSQKRQEISEHLCFAVFVCLFLPAWWRRGGVVISTTDFRFDGREIRRSVVLGWVGLFIAVSFSSTRNFAPHFLSSPRCINGYQRHTVGNPAIH